MPYAIRSVYECGFDSWRVYITDVSGSNPPLFRRVKGGSAEEARRNAEKLVDALNGRWTVKDALGEYLARSAQRVGPQTMRDYRAAASRLAPLHDVFVTRLAASDVQAFLDELGSRFGSSIVNKTRIVLKASLEIAVQKGEIGSNPCSVLRPARRSIRKVAPCERDRLLGALSRMDGQVVCAIALVAHGASMGEVCALGPGDLRGSRLVVSRRAERYIGGMCRVIEYETPKTVKIPGWLRAKLEEMEPRRYLFGDDRNPANADYMSRSAHRLLQALGMDVRLDDLRRSAEGPR